MTRCSRQTSSIDTPRIREQPDVGSLHSDKNGELLQKFFRFSYSVTLLEDDVATDGASHRRNELNNRLMRQAHRVFDEAPPQNLGRDLLLFGEAIIEPIDQKVRVNESGHARKGPLFANPCREEAASDAPLNACGAVRKLGRTDGAATLDLAGPPVCAEGRRESLPRLGTQAISSPGRIW
jgi:hypothetical protein